MTTTHADYQVSRLDALEGESIHVLREVAAEFEKPVLMFSGGKDSRDVETGELGLDEIGRVRLRTTVLLLCNPYSKDRTTGSFNWIDEATGVTVGAGMINSTG